MIRSGRLVAAACALVVVLSVLAAVHVDARRPHAHHGHEAASRRHHRRSAEQEDQHRNSWSDDTDSDVSEDLDGSKAKKAKPMSSSDSKPKPVKVATLGDGSKKECPEMEPASTRFKVCLLIPSSSKGLRVNRVEDLPIVNTFLPAFAESVKDETSKYSFQMYLGVDQSGDPWYGGKTGSDDNNAMLSKYIIKSGFNLDSDGFHLQLLPLGKHVTELWNILFTSAYNDGCHYFYQIGDDVKILTKGWASYFIDTLRARANFGIVGPGDTSNPQGNWYAEQSFVHRTHYNIFGYFFDPVIPDGSCDVWLSQVYTQPYTVVSGDYKVLNTVRTTRYRAHPGNIYIPTTVPHGRQIICDWLTACKQPLAPVYCGALRQQPVKAAFLEESH